MYYIYTHKMVWSVKIDSFGKVSRFNFAIECLHTLQGLLGLVDSFYEINHVGAWVPLATRCEKYSRSRINRPPPDGS